eukprot:2693136-Rhodomonas_salina.1
MSGVELRIMGLLLRGGGGDTSLRFLAAFRLQPGRERGGRPRRRRVQRHPAGLQSARAEPERILAEKADKSAGHAEENKERARDATRDRSLLPALPAPVLERATQSKCARRTPICCVLARLSAAESNPKAAVPARSVARPRFNAFDLAGPLFAGRTKGTREGDTQRQIQTDTDTDTAGQRQRHTQRQTHRYRNR